MDDIRAISHGLELSCPSHIISYVIDEDEAPLVKVVWVDVGVIMGLQTGLRYFDHLENILMILIGFFKDK